MKAKNLNILKILQALLVAIPLLFGGCGEAPEQPPVNSESEQDLPLGSIELGDFKADGTWGHATTCKSVPNLPALEDPYIVVSLNGLTLRLIDRATGFEKVYPIGVGEINREPGQRTSGESLSMYPVKRTGQNLFTIDTASINPCRIWWTDPDTRQKLPVFAGMPFIRFWGAYGIHGPITGFTQRNGGYLKRGYVSHGCVRMESADVLALWAYIKDTAKVPVRVQRSVERRDDGTAVELQQKWILSECQQDSDCNFDGGFCKKNEYSGRGFCTARCEKYCHYDKTGYPTTFCVADPDSPGDGFCTYKYSDFNYACRRYEGFLGHPNVSRNNQPWKKADVCLPGSQGWVGDSCLGNNDCGEGLNCTALGSDQPGYCSQSCTKFCPDKEGFAGTFCVADADGIGRCRARCNLNENDAGCGLGFECRSETRPGQSWVTRSACMPVE